MADNEQLHDLERSETENALLPAAFSVRAYQYEPRRPTITIAAYDSESGPSSEDETEPEEGGRLGNTDW